MTTIYKFVEYAVPHPEQIKPPDNMSWQRLWGPVLPLDEVMPLLQHELAGASAPTAYKLVCYPDKPICHEVMHTI